MRFLKAVGKPVPKNYFDPFSEKARSSIQYRDKVVSGLTSASKEGIYLESIFKFYVVIPWEIISAIRIEDVRQETFANLRIRQGGEIDRKLSICWNHAFEKFIPETVIVSVDRN